MNGLPPVDEMPEDADEQYRRAAALDSSRPSASSRRAILQHAARVTAERAAQRARSETRSWSFRKHRSWGPAAIGTLAAAVLAGLVIAPHYLGTARAPVFHQVASGAAPVAEPGSPPPLYAANAAPPPAKTGSTPESRPLTAPAAAAHFNAPVPAPAPAANEAAPAIESSRADSARRRAPLPSRPMADLAMPDPGTELGPAAAAGDLATLQTLLRANVNVNSRDSDGRTALMLATLNGHQEAVEMLLAGGADPRVPDLQGHTPLQVALAGHQASIAAELRRAGAR